MFSVKKTGIGNDILKNIILPLSSHGHETLKSLSSLDMTTMEGCVDSDHAQQSSSVKLKPSPFCFEMPDAQKEIRGWVLDVPGSLPGSKLPVCNKMFHGVSIAVCEVEESEILNMLQNASHTKLSLRNAISEIMKKSTKENKASWARCRPSVYSGYPSSLMQAVRDKDGSIVFEKDDSATLHSVPIIESDAWECEISSDGFVGFFHQWSHAHHRNKLKLYCICQSYLPTACQEFMDLVFKIGNHCTSGEVCLSEEMEWLRSCCSRNRARLIYEVCNAMKIKVATVDDYKAYQLPGNPKLLAMVTTETLHHDMFPVKADKSDCIRILNYCSETQRSYNGIACVMSPWDGIWVFQGINPFLNVAKKRICGMEDFGKSFGESVLCTSTPVVSKNKIDKNIGFRFTGSKENENLISLNLWNPGCVDGEENEPQAYLATDLCGHYALSSDKMLALDSKDLDPMVVEAYQRYVCNTQKKIKDNGSLSKLKKQQVSEYYYLFFDEHVFQAMVNLGWSRSSEIIKLIPVACGFYDHWWKDQGQAGLI